MVALLLVGLVSLCAAHGDPPLARVAPTTQAPSNLTAAAAASEDDSVPQPRKGGTPEEEARAILDIHKESPSGVSYIIHPDNMPPPVFKPLPNLTEGLPLKELARWRHQVLKKAFSKLKLEKNMTGPVEGSPEEEDGALQESFQSEDFEGINAMDVLRAALPEVIAEIQKASSSHPSRMHPSYSTTDAPPPLDPFLLKGESLIVEESPDADEQVGTQTEVMVEPEGTEDNPYVSLTDPLVDKDAEDILSDYSFLLSELHGNDFPPSNHTPRYEDPVSRSPQDLTSFLKDIANSQAFKRFFLGDLIRSFGSLDHNALKLIYSLLIAPLSKVSRTPTEPAPHSGSPPSLLPTSIPKVLKVNRPSSSSSRERLIQPSQRLSSEVDSEEWRWLPLPSTRPPSFARRGEDEVEVITAPPVRMFEIVLGSSLNSGAADARVHVAQNRAGIPADGADLELGQFPPPAEALSGLPSGSVLIPPSMVISRPDLHSLIERKVDRTHGPRGGGPGPPPQRQSATRHRLVTTKPPLPPPLFSGGFSNFLRSLFTGAEDKKTGILRDPGDLLLRRTPESDPRLSLQSPSLHLQKHPSGILLRPPPKPSNKAMYQPVNPHKQAAHPPISITQMTNRSSSEPALSSTKEDYVHPHVGSPDIYPVSEDEFPGSPPRSDPLLSPPGSLSESQESLNGLEELGMERYPLDEGQIPKEHLRILDHFSREFDRDDLTFASSSDLRPSVSRLPSYPEGSRLHPPLKGVSPFVPEEGLPTLFPISAAAQGGPTPRNDSFKESPSYYDSPASYSYSYYDDHNETFPPYLYEYYEDPPTPDNGTEGGVSHHLNRTHLGPPLPPVPEMEFHHETLLQTAEFPPHSGLLQNHRLINDSSSAAISSRGDSEDNYPQPPTVYPPDEVQDDFLHHPDYATFGRAADSFLRKPPKQDAPPEEEVDLDTQLSNMWKHVQVVPLEPAGDYVGVGVRPSLGDPDSEPQVTAKDVLDDSSPSGGGRAGGNHFMAYVLVASCFGLALVAVAGIVILLRFKRTCGSGHIRTRGPLKDAESYSRRFQHDFTKESGHKLGSWFTGRTQEHVGSGKLRSNMTLPSVEDLRWKKDPKSSSTRDLLADSSESSPISTLKDSRRSYKSEKEAEEPRSSWLHGGGGGDFTAEDSEGSVAPHPAPDSAKGGHSPRKARREYESDQSCENPTRVTYYNSESSLDLDHLKGIRRHRCPPEESCFTEEDEEETCASQYTSRELQTTSMSLNSTDLGDRISQSLRLLSKGERLPSHREDTDEDAKRSCSQMSFSRENIQNEVLIHFENIFRDHGHFLGPDGGSSSNSGSGGRPSEPSSSPSRSRDHVYARHKAASAGESPPRIPPKFTTPPPPPRPPKPEHLTHDSSSPRSEKQPVQWSSEDERLI